MTKSLLTVSRTGSVIAILSAVTLCAPAFAETVNTIMLGHIGTVSPPLQGLGIQVGDVFSLSFTFDNALSTYSETVVGGTHYDLTTYNFNVSNQAWQGSLPNLLAARNASGLSQATRQIWSRPLGTLHHEEWTIDEFGLFMIVNYAAAGGGSYGWYQYGNAANIPFLIDDVVTTPIPEPSTNMLFLAGSVAIAALVRRRIGLSRISSITYLNSAPACRDA